MSVTDSATKLLNDLQSSELLDSAEVKAALESASVRDAASLTVAVRLVQSTDLSPWQVRQFLDGNGSIVTIGPWELIYPAGRGSGGVVFRAKHLRTREEAAVKILTQNLTERPDAVGRFQREARTALRLNHPSIVACRETGEDNGRFYLVLEFVEGMNLRDAIAEAGRLPWKDVAVIGRDIAQGLAYAAEHNVVHRDIKPSNIIVTHFGTAKLLDLGLARSYAEVGDDTLTKTGQILGTVDYISPEQARDSRLADPRSDIYSLGCTLYHAVTGQVPYPVDSVAEKLVKHLTSRPVPVAEHIAVVPPDVCEIIARAMSTDADARFQSASELADALGRYVDDARISDVTLSSIRHSAMAVPLENDEQVLAAIQAAEGTSATQQESPPPSRQVSTVIVTALLSIVAATAFWLWYSASGTIVFSLPTANANALITIDGVAVSESEVSLRRGEHRVRIEQDGYETMERMVTIGAERVTTFREALKPTPDTARRLLLEALTADVDELESKNASVEASAEVRQRLTEFQFQYRSSGDGQESAGLAKRLRWPVDELSPKYSSPYEESVVEQCRQDGRLPDQVVAVLGSSRFHHHRIVMDVKWTPDGSRVISSSEDGTACVWDTSTGLRTLTLRHDTMLLKVVVLQDGERCVATGADGALFVHELSTGRLIHRIEPPLVGIRYTFEAEVQSMALNSDGAILATGCRDGCVRLWDTKAWRHLRTLRMPGVEEAFGGDRFVTGVAFGPRDEWLAAAARFGNLQYWNHEDGSELKTVKLVQQPISMAAGKDGLLALGGSTGRVMYVDYQNEVVDESVKLSGTVVRHMAFSPNGDQLVCQELNNRLCLLDVNTHETLWSVSVSGYAGLMATAFSPDGTVIATGGWNGAIRLWNAASGDELTKPFDPGCITDMRVFPDGRRFVTIHNGGAVREWNLHNGNCRLRYKTPAFPRGLAVSRDGRFLAAGDASVAVMKADTLGGPTWINGYTDGGRPALAFHPSATLLAAADRHGELSIWRTESGEQIFSGRPAAADWCRMVWALHEPVIYLSSMDGQIYSWNTQTEIGKWLYKDPKVKRAFDLCLSPDETRLAVTAGNRVRLLNTQDGQVFRTLNTQPVGGRSTDWISVDFSPDGQLLAVAPSNGQVEFWDISSADTHRVGNPIRIGPAAGVIAAVRFTPDGRHLLAAMNNGTVVVLRIDDAMLR